VVGKSWCGTEFLQVGWSVTAVMELWNYGHYN